MSDYGTYYDPSRPHYGRWRYKGDCSRVLRFDHGRFTLSDVNDLLQTARDANLYEIKIFHTGIDNDAVARSSKL